MPVFRPRRASVRTWSSVRRTSASIPPIWIAPSSLVKALGLSCWVSGLAVMSVVGAEADRMGSSVWMRLTAKRFGRDAGDAPVFLGHVVDPDAHVFFGRAHGVDQRLGHLFDHGPLLFFSAAFEDVDLCKWHVTLPNSTKAHRHRAKVLEPNGDVVARLDQDGFGDAAGHDE